MEDPVARLDEDPALRRGLQARVEAERVTNEVVELGERLDTGIARADEHEREMRRSGREIGSLELGEHVVAERDRVGEVVEAESVLGEARNGQRARDRAEGEHQPVVAHLEAAGVRLDRDRARTFVERGR